MWLSLEDTYAVMDDHANSVEENVKEFKTLLEPIYRYLLYRTLLYCTVPRFRTLQDCDSPNLSVNYSTSYPDFFKSFLPLFILSYFCLLIFFVRLFSCFLIFLFLHFPSSPLFSSSLLSSPLIFSPLLTSPQLSSPL